MRCGLALTVVGVAGFALSVVLVPSPRIPAAQAQDAKVCRFERSVEQGLGGTGIRSTDVLSRLTSIIPIEQGLGGTGAIDTGSRGLGGTGVIAALDERGLGGTGIIGIVTGFASVCVNGYEVEVTADTAVSVEGFSADDGDIRLGQLVTVEAYPVDGVLTAASVSVQVAVAGPIEAIDIARSTLSVAGQTVEVAGFGNSISLEGLNPGDWVVVSGLRPSDDLVAASSIVSLERPGTAVVVSGPVRETQNGLLSIGAVTLDTDAASVGDVVVARGTLENNTLAAQSVTVRPARPFTPGIQSFSILGFPERGPNGESVINGVPLPADVQTPGQQPVQVDGTVTANGTFSANSAAPQPPPVDGAAPNNPSSQNNNGGNGANGTGGGQGNGSGNGNGNGANGAQNNPQPLPLPLPNNGGGGNNNGGGGNGSGSGTGNGQGNGQGNGGGNGQDNSNSPNSGNNTSPQPQSNPAPALSAPSSVAAPAPEPEQPARPQAVESSPERSSTSARPEAPARPERADRPEPPSRPERPERPDRPDRPDTPSRPERPERPDRPR